MKIFDFLAAVWLKKHTYNIWKKNPEDGNRYLDSWFVKRKRGSPFFLSLAALLLGPRPTSKRIQHWHRLEHRVPTFHLRPQIWHQRQLSCLFYPRPFKLLLAGKARLLNVEGHSQAVPEPDGFPRAIQADKKDRERQLRFCLPSWAHSGRTQIRSESLFKRIGLQRVAREVVPNKRDLNNEKTDFPLEPEANRGLLIWQLPLSNVLASHWRPTLRENKGNFVSIQAK